MNPGRIIVHVRMPALTYETRSLNFLKICKKINNYLKTLS